MSAPKTVTLWDPTHVHLHTHFDSFMEPNEHGSWVSRSDYDALAERVRELEGDAARYRWLRRHYGDVVFRIEQAPEEWGATLDATIDAMQQDGG